MIWRSRPAGRSALCRAVAMLSAAFVSLPFAACDRPPEMVPDRAVEGELAAGESTEFRLVVDAGRFVELTATPVGTAGPARPLLVRIAADGHEVASGVKAIEGPAGGRFVWLTDARGEYEIELSAAEPLLPAEYRMQVATREAEAGDGWRVAALRAESAAARLYDDREIDRAADEIRLARSFWRRTADAVAEIDAVLSLAALEEEAGRTDQAFRFYDEAAGVAEEAAEAGWTAEAMLRRGRLSARLGRIEAAEQTYREARTIAEGVGDGVRVATIVFNQGSLLLRRGRLDEAWAAMVEAGQVARAADDPLTEAYALRTRARILRLRFELSAARELALQALDVARRAGDEGCEAEAAIVHELGVLAMQQGELSSALDYFEESVRLNRAFGNWPRVRDSLRSLGVLAFSLRDRQAAEDYARQALELAEALGDPVATAECLRELGAVLAWHGRHDEAEALYRRAMATVPEDADEVRASVLHRLGVLDLERGRSAEAIERLREAAALRSRSGDRDGLALTHLKLGAALLEAGRLDDARERLAAALDHYRRQSWPDEIAISLYQLAQLELAAGRPDHARVATEEALDLLRGLRAGLATDSMRLEFFSRVRPVYDLYVHLLMRLAAERPGQGFEARAFQASEEARARGLLDLLSEAEADADVRQGIDPDLERTTRETELSLNFLRGQLAGALAADPDSEQSRRLREVYEATEERLQQLDRRLQALSPSYRDLRIARPRELEEIQGSLGPGRALIEYWIGRRGSYVFAVTDGGLEVRELPPADRLRERATALRRALRSILPRDRFAEDARWLYAELLGPVEAAVDDREEWIVVPDGPLQTLPFEVLLATGGGGGERYLAETRAISYAPSATVLAALARGAPSPADPSAPRFAVFADPAVEGDATVICPREEAGDDAGPLERVSSVAALPASRLEARELIRLHGEGATRAFLGVAASERAVKQTPELASAARIHFATHGLVCESRPERSALVLAGGAGEDGLLELREVFGLRLAADLVVLSACETGLGRNVEGEGVVGLARAFLYAGADSVVVSLWRVADESTAELMVAFYRQLEARGAGADKAEALRAAKRAMIAGGGTRSHPYHWAPFILIGSRETAGR